jgi:formylglycine-generating enzyme required for sulfatase activity
VVRVIIAIVLWLLPASAFAQAEKRIALLIGNKDYKTGVGALTNPLNDIRIVGDALKSVGFEVLKPVENAQRSAMLIAIHAFAAKLKVAGPDAVGFLYYSGHGIASAGENYLSEAGEAWGATKDSTNTAVLESFIVRYKDTFYAELARARIEDLKKQQVASPPPKREQPTTVTGTLRCESYSERTACTADTFCSWIDDRKQCQRKSGSLTTALLEATPKATSPGTCSGVEALVGNEKRCLKPGDSFKDCPDCPEMVVVPAGEFMMGSPEGEADRRDDEGLQHKVTIAKPFAVGKYEVTLAEWNACVNAGGCKHEGYSNISGDKAPVTFVSWDHITKEFLPWLSRKTGQTYRLLAEAEWSTRHAPARPRRSRRGRRSPQPGQH